MAKLPTIHQERQTAGHCTGGTELVVHRSARELSPEEWNAIAGIHPMAQHGVLATYECANTHESKPYYFLRTRDGQPVAAAVGYLGDTVESCGLITTPLLGRARFLGPALMQGLGSMLIACLRPSCGAALLVDPTLDVGQRRAELQGLCAQLEEYADDNNISLALAGLTHRDQLLHEVLQSRGYDGTMQYPTAEMPINWKDWGGYLQGFPAARRKMIRREKRIFEKAGGRVRRLRREDALPDGLISLLHNHYRRKCGRDAPYERELLEALRKNLDEDVIFYVAEVEEQILGFVSFVRNGNLATAMLVGINEEAAASNFFVYFNLCYYRIACDAPHLGIDRVLFGTTVYQAKRLRGCEIVPMRFYLRPRKGLLRAVSGPAIRLHRSWYEKKLGALCT